MLFFHVMLKLPCLAGLECPLEENGRLMDNVRFAVLVAAHPGTFAQMPSLPMLGKTPAFLGELTALVLLAGEPSDFVMTKIANPCRRP